MQSFATSRRPRGFTLIELLIAVVIVATLAAIALPAYFDTIRKSRRSDAVTAVAAVQQAQERFRANNTSYGSRFTVSSGNLTGVSSSTTDATTYTTANGYYQLSFPSGSTADDKNYTVRATAQGSQANDTSCKVMDMVYSTGSITYKSGSTTSTATDNGTCWKK